jgi:hypothetical protein
MRTIPEPQRQEIEQYISQDLDTLYSVLDLIRSSQEPVSYLPGNEIVRGIAKFDEFVPLLRQKVCEEWDFCTKRNDPELSDTINLAAEIADIIATSIIGFPPTLISTILVKKGLTAFCMCRENQKKQEKESHNSRK